ncbi:hypothetical protein [Plantactinospora sp. CA-290183]|uniref:hypothetical protein n=1 Tax=Plantactinospora sp. CA-290183 TaxID=3240006 RepID=UPI003D92BF9F
MDDLDPRTGHRLDAAFAGFRSDALDRMIPPDPDVVRRIAHRRLRNRVTAAGALAAVVLAGGVAAVIGNDPRPPAPPATDPPPATATARPSPPVGPTAGTTPTPTPPASPSATPSLPAAPTTPARDNPGDAPDAPPAGPGRPTDLAVSAPTEVNLSPSGDRYAGSITFTVHNRGRQPYEFTGLRVVQPLELDIRLIGDDAGPCNFGEQDTETRMLDCHLFSNVPAGGAQNVTMTITAAVAPAPGTRTVDGFRITALSALDGEYLTDRTPADNSVSVRVHLSGG